MAKHIFYRNYNKFANYQKKNQLKIKKPKRNRFYKIGTFLFLKQNVNNRKKLMGAIGLGVVRSETKPRPVGNQQKPARIITKPTDSM